MYSLINLRKMKAVAILLIFSFMNLLYLDCSKNESPSGPEQNNEASVDANGSAQVSTDNTGRAAILSEFFNKIEFEISDIKNTKLNNINILYQEVDEKCFIEVSDTDGKYQKFCFWGDPNDFERTNYISSSLGKVIAIQKPQSITLVIVLVATVASTLYASYSAYKAFNEIHEFWVTDKVIDEFGREANIKTISQIMDYVKSQISATAAILTIGLNVLTFGTTATATLPAHGALEATNAVAGFASGPLSDYWLAWYNDHKKNEWGEADINTKFIVKEFTGERYTLEEGRTTFMGLDIEPYLGNNLDIYSNPSGATIYIDGANMNKTTPAKFSDIEVGQHEIRLYKFGYNEYEETVIVPLNGIALIYAQFGDPLPPLPVFTINQPRQNDHFSSNVLTVSGSINLQDAHGETYDFSGDHAILSLNGVDQEIPVNNGNFSQDVLIVPGENYLRLRANSNNGDTGVSEEIVFYGDFTTTDIQIILRWNNGTGEYGDYTLMKDVDLHLYDSEGHHTYWMCSDQYYTHSGYDNAIANMIPGSELDIDNTWGYGPETFTLPTATNTTYTVKAHFYSGYDDANQTSANIEIILKGINKKTYGPYRFKNSYQLRTSSGQYVDNASFENQDCWWDVVSFTVDNGLPKIVTGIAPNIDIRDYFMKKK